MKHLKTEARRSGGHRIKTGGILSMVSAPSYDPNLFVSGSVRRITTSCSISQTGHCLIARFAASIPPGSTIKPLFGLIGLHNNSITMDYSIKDPGLLSLWKALNGPGGTITLSAAATARASIWPRLLLNPAMCIFYKMSVKTGIDLLSTTAKVWSGHLTRH